MKLYNEYDSVEELYEAFNIKPLSVFLNEAEGKKNDSDEIPDKAKKRYKGKGKKNNHSRQRH